MEIKRDILKLIKQINRPDVLLYIHQILVDIVNDIEESEDITSQAS